MVFIYSMKMLFCLGDITVYGFFKKSFLTDIDFWSARVIQGFILNLNWYLFVLTFYKVHEYHPNRNTRIGLHYADLVGEFQIKNRFTLC